MTFLKEIKKKRGDALSSPFFMFLVAGLHFYPTHPLNPLFLNLTQHLIKPKFPPRPLFQIPIKL